MHGTAHYACGRDYVQQHGPTGREGLLQQHDLRLLCRLSVEAKIPCPYKGCLHITNPSQEADHDPNEAAATQMQAETANEIAALDKEIMDEAEEDQARAETMASELAAIGSKTPGNKPPGDDLR